eukprot:5763208-Pyramimonas_sp.AAC.1
MQATAQLWPAGNDCARLRRSGRLRPQTTMHPGSNGRKSTLAVFPDRDTARDTHALQDASGSERFLVHPPVFSLWGGSCPSPEA